MFKKIVSNLSFLNIYMIIRSNWNIRGLILLCFFFTGLAGLVYQVLWERQLGLVFGTTLQAVSTILAVYMAGLALGSFLFGRIADRSKNPLRLFAILEIVIGVYVLLTPLIFKGLTALQVSVYHQIPDNTTAITIIKIVLCLIVLIVPTTLMGGTLPVISRFCVRKEEELGRGVGNLYFANTLGAVFGAFLAGFVLIWLVGVQTTTIIAACIDLAVGILFLLLYKRYTLTQQPVATVDITQAPLASLSRKALREERKRDRKEAKVQSAKVVSAFSRVHRNIVLIVFSFAGLASLSLEVSWTRVLSLILGNSVYAFSLMLTAFLLGIAIGSLISAKFVDRSKHLWRNFVIIEALIGVSILVLNPLLGQLPLLFQNVFVDHQENFWALQTLEFLICFAILLIPTILMGAAFPIATKIYTANIERLGGSLGRLYAGNTLGAMIGPILTGFIIIPLTSIQFSIAIVAAIYLSIASVAMIVGPNIHWYRLPATVKRNLNPILWLKAFTYTPLGIIWVVHHPLKISKVIIMMVPVALIVISLFIPVWISWNKRIITSGQYLYANNTSNESMERRITSSSNMLFYDEGLLSTVTVENSADGNKLLRIDGKVDASILLNIGLGNGITLEAIEQYSALEKVEAIEIEKSIISAASEFADYNNDALNNSKLKLITADARNYILATKQKYDVITAEPSNPWMAGNSILFTKEQFQLYRDHLNDNGIVCQWIQYYSMGTEDLKTVLNTFVSVFPHSTLWSTEGDLLLIGSINELKIDFKEFKQRVQETNVLASLNRIGINDAYGVLGTFVMDEKALASYTNGARLHTDNHPILQFSAPKNLYNKYSYQANLTS
ncbi:MAG: fused MFS/spermidine synthase, partial [Chloroflexi bacterium]|nr:fused MFS/spermidine synthase [Chloroflexota bacterium]